MSHVKQNKNKGQYYFSIFFDKFGIITAMTAEHDSYPVERFREYGAYPLDVYSAMLDKLHNHLLTNSCDQATIKTIEEWQQKAAMLPDETIVSFYTDDVGTMRPRYLVPQDKVAETYPVASPLSVKNID